MDQEETVEVEAVESLLSSSKLAQVNLRLPLVNKNNRSHPQPLRKEGKKNNLQTETPVKSWPEDPPAKSLYSTPEGCVASPGVTSQ